MIRTGNVAYELLRPVDLYGLWFSRMLAGRVAPTLLRCVPQLALAGLMGWLYWPGLSAAGAFVAALFWRAAAEQAMGVLLTTTVFWTISGVGVHRLIAGVTALLSGFLIPLPLLPDSCQKVIAFLPFRGLADAPFPAIPGHHSARGLAGRGDHQLAWTAALALLTRWLIARSLRRVVVQGG